jgi:DHA2 family multidrug resistance protein-like MFS transporter
MQALQKVGGPFGGVAVSRKLGSPALLESVRAAFVHGMDLALALSSEFAVIGLVLALAFLPKTAAAAAASKEPGPADTDQEAAAVAV